MNDRASIVVFARKVRSPKGWLLGNAQCAVERMQVCFKREESATEKKTACNELVSEGATVW